MLIAIAGPIGAGKSTVAKAVSARLEIPFHAIDDDKLALGATHPEFAEWITNATPFPDNFREAVFDRALHQLEVLAHEHTNVIVEETFHRRRIRQPFFSGAADRLGGICLVEISVSREVALAHLATRQALEADHMAGAAMYDAFVEVADPLEGVDLEVANNGDLDATVDAVCLFLTERLQL